jgi:Zn-dependent peptidase ImmA (M78 family)
LSSTQLLKRGFKAKADKLSISYREQLDLKAWEPICAFKIAEYLKIPFYKATDFVSTEKEIETLKQNEWSALTMETKIGNRIIIFNPFHSKQRQQSDIMHELAHIICEHKRDKEKYDFAIPFGMHEFDEIQEEEAKCLGATLQLSKACLFWSNKRDLNYDEIALKFYSSTEMVRYRMNITGIAKRKLTVNPK